MDSLIGYLFLGAGTITFLASLFVDSRKSMPLKFAAIVFVLCGLVILQFIGADAPPH
jgi:hypothetical protein